MKTSDSFSGIKTSLIFPAPFTKQSLNESFPATGIKQSRQPDVRSELLHQIKKRIESGYYNNESVIDDIGYGFAQALDSTL